MVGVVCVLGVGSPGEGPLSGSAAMVLDGFRVLVDVVLSVRSLSRSHKLAGMNAVTGMPREWMVCENSRREPQKDTFLPLCKYARSRAFEDRGLTCASAQSSTMIPQVLRT